MSLDLETRLKTFFASAPQAIHSVQTIEISHSAMSRTFRLWREPYEGVAGGYAVQPANIEIKLAGSEGHLDQKFDISISTVDTDDTLRDELDRIPINTIEKIKIIYREYLSDDLVNAQAMVTLQAESISYEIGAANISAVSPRLNMSRTGEAYSPKDVPMLRGFL